MAEPARPQREQSGSEALKARLVLRALDTDRPEDYDAWRHATRAEIAGFGADPERAMAYVGALDQPDLYPPEDLRRAIEEQPEMRMLDVRLYAAILACLRGSMQQAAEERICAQVPFGAGGLALRKLDTWFNHGSKKRKAAATRRLLALKPAGSSAGAMESFLSTFRLLTKQAGNGVGEEVQLDVLQRAVEGHPRLAMVWYAWRAAGGHGVESLLEMLEEATADGMFGTRGARPGGAAWAAVTADDSSRSQVQWGTPEPGRSAAMATAQSAGPAIAGGPECWWCGKRGHRQYECPSSGKKGEKGKGKGANSIDMLRTRMDRMERTLERISNQLGPKNA